MQLIKHMSVIFLLLTVLLLAGCGAVRPAAAETAQEEAPATAPEKASTSAEQPKKTYTLAINELMIKNRATVRDEDGDFSDWIELVNTGSEALSLKGVFLGDKAGKLGWELPDAELSPGEYLLVFASGKDRRDGELHTDFSLSEGETLYLKDELGNVIASLECSSDRADCSLLPDGTVTAYPTPAAANDISSYIAAQQLQSYDGALAINEVCTYNTVRYAVNAKLDWVELKNISSEYLNLSQYSLSDDFNTPDKLRLPDMELSPGAVYLAYCGEESFELSSDSDRVYLFCGEELCDYVPLADLPYGGSKGREDGQNGWFFFSACSPGADNYGGSRYISEQPSCLTRDGVYEDIDSLTIELSGKGRIFYTTDGSLPTEWSTEYTGPLTITETTALRAVSIEPGALASRAASFNFFLNEGHVLPIAAMNFDDINEFWGIWLNGWKAEEICANLSFYESDGSFSIDCGMKLNGESSLVLQKKNMSLRFRGVYGEARLEYDLYKGGVAEFQNILLRAGQDYYNTVIRNELCQELCLEFSDNVISQRSRFCVLYINGEYVGVYTLKEKTNEAMYAIMTGTDIDKATAYEARILEGNELYSDVFDFCFQNDMRDSENYAELCRHLDVDSLIDWLIAEGICANNDLNSGNIRYVMSTETDGRWRLMFYDLDATLKIPDLIFTNVISKSRSNQQVTALARELFKNADFRARFLERTAEALNGAFSEENMLRKIDELAAELEPELERDFELHELSMQRWYNNIRLLKSNITDNNWTQTAIENLDDCINLTDEELALYFG